MNTFLIRLRGLRETPDLPGKEELFQLLEDTGLTEVVVLAMPAQVNTAKTEFEAQPPSLVSEEELRKAEQLQPEAFGKLERWYTLWSGILRQGLDYHKRIRLGISEAKGGRKPKEEPAPETPEPQS